MTLNLEITDDHAGKTYSIQVHGTAHAAVRATGPSYWSGGEPGEPAHFEIHRIDIDYVIVTEGKYSLTLPTNSADIQYAGFCREIEEKFTDEIAEKALEAAGDEAESQRAYAEEARYEAAREREWERRNNVSRYADSDDAA